MKLLFKISTSYWKHNITKLFLLLLSVIISSAALCSTMLLIRSLKSDQLEGLLVYHGNYDVIVYDTNESTKDYLDSYQGFAKTGNYANLGTVESPDSFTGFSAACFSDNESEDMYHMTCISGHYPATPDEVAVDTSVVDALGLSPYPGSIVRLRLRNPDTNEAIDDEYTISGIFEATDSSVYGGWHRYPSELTEGEYNKMPAVFMHHSLQDRVHSEEYVFYAQCDTTDSSGTVDFDTYITDSNTIQSVEYYCIDWTQSRSLVYDILLKFGEDYWSDNEDAGMMSGIESGVSNGYAHMDFYSKYLIPIYSSLILIIVFLLQFNNVRNVINNRSRFYGILRSIGMDAKTCSLYLLCEIIIISVFATVIGLALGTSLHVASVYFANRIAGTSLPYGVITDSYVSSVTHDPWIIPFVATLITVILSSLALLMHLYRTQPVILLSGESVKVGLKRRRKKVLRSSKNNTGWLILLNSRIDLHSLSVMLMIAIILSSSLFGYLFFMSYSDSKSDEYRYEIIESGLENYDYSAQISNTLHHDGLYAMNHHSYGITNVAIDKLLESEDVEKSFVSIVNDTTRLSFLKENITDDLRKLFEGKSLGLSIDKDSVDGQVYKGYEKLHEMVVKETGYDLLHEYYLISSFGLSRDSICELNCVDGSVDFDKMASGEEVLIFAHEDLVELTTKNFTVGQILPLSDVVVSEEEEDLPFGNIDYFDPGVECTYREHIKTDSGDNVIVAGKAYGKRKDINTKVGAIISVSDEQIHEFFGDYSGLGIICLDNRSFSSWGLPNRNYTDFKVKLRDDASRSDFDKYWYETIGECKGIRINSTYHLWDKIYMSNASNMTVYYLILFTLFITGCLSVTVSLYTKIKIRDNEITILRRLGMTVGQVRLLIISQNIFYPVIGTLIGIIPVYVLQSVFDYIKRKMESGAWDNKPGVEDATAWFFDLPYYKNMFDYNFVPALIVCLIIGVVLIVIGTIPQMIILRRHKLIEN